MNRVLKAAVKAAAAVCAASLAVGTAAAVFNEAELRKKARPNARKVKPSKDVQAEEDAAKTGQAADAQEAAPDRLPASDRPKGFYEKHVKRPLDCTLATGALIALSPILAGTAFLVRSKLGSPVIFSQPRPGRIDPDTGQERIFRLYKFRSMTDERGEDGELLPDSARLTPFGKFLRASSLDELPELVNIIRGDMAVIGPRPQLVRDMVFMSKEQRQRHTVRPGLSGLAQVNGRNGISWDDKLAWDLRYLGQISFLTDTKLVLRTFIKTGAQEGITDGVSATAADFGDALLAEGRVTKEEYDRKQEEAREILEHSF